MRSKLLAAALAACGLGAAASALAAPVFVNGLVIPGSSLDATGVPGANAGRLGFFSDIYYDPIRRDWWALSDRGPGGGVLDYQTRLNKFKIKVDPKTGEISKFRVVKTILLSDPLRLLDPPTSTSVANLKALNGLNPLLLNGSAATLGRSFDPEGLVVHPRTGHFIIADEYGPSVYEFGRHGELLRVFQTPANLVPKAAGVTDYVSDRSVLTAGRQDNRGFEGIAVTPDGSKLVGILQDPLVNEPPPNNGRDGRTLRIVVFDSVPGSPTYGTSIAQYAYQLEPQADVRARIVAAGGTATATDPRQGRNLGASAIVALNDHEFLVLERDNRGIGVDDPAGASVIGSKRVFAIDIAGATDITSFSITLPAGALPASVTPVTKTAAPFIDLAANTVLPNGKKPEKWEGLTIGPRLKGGNHLILTGNDNDYSVTQNASSVQFDVYVNFLGASVQRDLDQPTKLNGATVGAPDPGFVLLPGVLHAYRASAADLAHYDAPGFFPGDFDHDDDDDDDDDDDGDD